MLTGKQVEIADIAAAHKGHWFSDGAMRFFGTRLLGVAHRGSDGLYYFVTSEQPPHGPRAYSVRSYCKESDTVNTVGDLCGYGSAEEAHERVAFIVEEGL